jgi:hypothetical protein
MMLAAEADEGAASAITGDRIKHAAANLLTEFFTDEPPEENRMVHPWRLACQISDSGAKRNVAMGFKSSDGECVAMVVELSRCGD